MTGSLYTLFSKRLKEEGVRSTFLHPFPSKVADRKRMYDFVKRFWMLNRTAVNEDTDRLVYYLKEAFGGEVIEAQSGEEIDTWVIPLHWKVKRGILKTLRGEVLADYNHNPLYLWTHSVSFQGKVSRDELFEKHILTDPARPSEIPYHYRNGYKYGCREWGFSLPFDVVQKMEDPYYFVDIDTVLDTNRTLKVVDIFLPGRYADTFFIMAHTCHPAQVSDGLANIGIALEVYHSLKRQKDRRFSYRFIFGPEYFGSLVFLRKSKREVVEHLKCGLYLDMLSNNEPIGYQTSFLGNHKLDEVVENVLRSHTQIYVKKGYRELWGNDETFFEGPGYRIPVVGLGRLMHREYHYSSDDIENMNIYHMEESVWIINRIIEVLETDYIPELKYRFPLYISRHKDCLDHVLARLTMRDIEKIQILIDGRNSCFDISKTLGIDFFAVREFCDSLHRLDLLDKKEITTL